MRSRFGSRLLRAAPRELLAGVELIFLDVDGCLTDGARLSSGEGGTLYRYSVVDGLGAWLLSRVGAKVVIVSASENPSIVERAKQMCAYSFETGVSNKEVFVRSMMASLAVERRQVCVMGDDLWDIRAMRLAAVSVCPSDARPEVKREAIYRTRARGGQGSVRELADAILAAKGYRGGRLIDLLE